MELKTPEITFDHQRINSESDLQFNGVDQYFPVVLDGRYDFGMDGWSMMRFFEVADVVQNPFLFEINGAGYNLGVRYDTNTSLLRVNINTPGMVLKQLDINIGDMSGDKVHLALVRIDNIISIYVNSIAVGQIDTLILGDTHNFGSATSYLESERTSLAGDYLNGKQVHITWFNKTVLEQEIQWNYFRASVAITAHENCVAHYPLTSRYAFKPDVVIDATFLGKGKNSHISAGNLVVFDMAEQYNYAKVTPLEANHAILQNFTDAETGAGGDIRTQTFKNDFYPPKSTLQWWAGAGAPAPEDNTEDVTGLPPITHAFDCSFTRYVTVPNFLPTKEKGYTYIIGFAMNADANFTVKSGLFYKSNFGFSPIKQTLGKNGTKKISWINDPNAIDSDDLAVINSPHWIIATEQDGLRESYVFGSKSVDFDLKSPLTGWDELTGGIELRIGSLDAVAINGLDGSLFFVGIWKGILSPKKINQIVNNSLGANDLDKDCQLYLLFSNGNFSENGVDVLITDHSPESRTCEVIGLTGATSADRLADVPNHLTTINTLR